MKVTKQGMRDLEHLVSRGSVTGMLFTLARAGSRRFPRDRYRWSGERARSVLEAFETLDIIAFPIGCQIRAARCERADVEPPLVKVGQSRLARGRENGSAGVALRGPCCSECTTPLGSRAHKGLEWRATRPCGPGHRARYAPSTTARHTS